MSQESYVCCSVCGETFRYMDLLVDHHSEEHRTFDRVMELRVTGVNG
jgi:hypothetical protein